jgi:hypothetical protein
MTLEQGLATATFATWLYAVVRQVRGVKTTKDLLQSMLPFVLVWTVSMAWFVWLKPR